eukprot:TRINITY_DN11331_c0_g1_i2.p1 TRINITY_DN11331_c0_g1~~TRINITY_DN11331_c0_g1_i2.p1  ORF type:complete len:164 (+),score=35.47 TRINITY_DN11331_c0_g1_i2:119-610(+)
MSQYERSEINTLIQVHKNKITEIATIIGMTTDTAVSFAQGENNDQLPHIEERIKQFIKYLLIERCCIQALQYVMTIGDSSTKSDEFEKKYKEFEAKITDEVITSEDYYTDYKKQLWSVTNPDEAFPNGNEDDGIFIVEKAVETVCPITRLTMTDPHRKYRFIF